MNIDVNAPNRRFKRLFRNPYDRIAILVIVAIFGVGLFGCAGLPTPAQLAKAAADFEAGVGHLQDAQGELEQLAKDPALTAALDDLLLAEGAFENVAADLGWRFAPPSYDPNEVRQGQTRAEWERLAREMGVNESCSSRCWSCTGTNVCKACPVEDCYLNCANGHHPVCLYGCTPGGQCPYGDCPDAGQDRTYSGLADLLDAVAADLEGGLADSPAIQLMESCGTRCDKCHTCHNGNPDQCPANRCCDPIDCWDNCAEKQHPICCAGC